MTMIIGCNFHPSFQQIAYVDQETGEYRERRLNHVEEAERFYRSLAGKRVRVGVEATGSLRWFRPMRRKLRPGGLEGEKMGKVLKIKALTTADAVIMRS